jgi:hypothetical protein
MIVPATDVLNVTQSWIAIRFRTGFAATDDPYGAAPQPCLWSWQTDSTHDYRIHFNVGNDTWACIQENGTSKTAASAAQTFAYGTTQTIIGAWDSSNNIKLSLNGGAFTVANDFASKPTSLPSTWLIGDRFSLDRQMNGEYLWVIVGSGTLSDADAATIHAFGDTDPDISLIPGAVTMFWAATSDDYYTAASANTLMQKQMAAVANYQ